MYSAMKKNKTGRRGRDQFCARIFSDDLAAKVNLEEKLKGSWGMCWAVLKTRKKGSMAGVE